VITKPGPNDGGLSKGQLDLIEQFVSDYNAVDRYLRKVLGCDSHVTFTHLVNMYACSHPTWRDTDLLKVVAEVRNAVVHGKTEPYHYVAVPTPSLVQRLRACRERLTSPARAIPVFQRKVERVSTQDDLAKVLKIIKHRDYSQFPVYEAEKFRGLLTENGITRWLAHHVTTELSLVELGEVSVQEVLRSEEKRKNYDFVAREARVDEVVELFALEKLLEAVLITASGKESEALLGIATRWDIIHLNDGALIRVSNHDAETTQGSHTHKLPAGGSSF
jgi:predicted transcriptional regulator